MRTKRLAMVAGAAVMVVAAMLLFAPGGSVPAAADGGPHGGYTATTDDCAGCHRAHTAQAPKLLTASVDQLCLTCHGDGATGADTNVVDGVYTDNRDGTVEDPAEGVALRGLKGGGFTNTLMDTDLDAGTAPGGSTTSAHTYDGASATLWGNGAISSGAGLAGFSLTCVNCHDPHGNGNYRILRPIPSGSGATAAVLVEDETEKNYTVFQGGDLIPAAPSGGPIVDGTVPGTATSLLVSVPGQYLGEGLTGWYNPYPYDVIDYGWSQFGDPDGASRSQHGTHQYQELSGWCSTCHTRYLAEGNDTADTDSGDSIFAYRHRSDAVATGLDGCAGCHRYADTDPDNDDVENPGSEWVYAPEGSKTGIGSGYGNLHDVRVEPFITFDDGQFNHTVTCMTCHVAHGTSATLLDGGWSEAVQYPDGTTADPLPSDARSSLLRVDGRGVCEACHDKGAQDGELTRPYGVGLH